MVCRNWRSITPPPAHANHGKEYAFLKQSSHRSSSLRSENLVSPFFGRHQSPHTNPVKPVLIGADVDHRFRVARVGGLERRLELIQRHRFAIQ